jgi:hypothetical protein
MPFTPKISRKETIKLLRSICKERNVKVTFTRRLGHDIAGEADTENEHIWISRDMARGAMAQATFHELGHIYCVRNNLFMAFHSSDDWPANEVFEAENFIERWAQKEWDKLGMRKLFGRYHFAYLRRDKRTIVKWLAQHFEVEE